jgi:hypothetical protein
MERDHPALLLSHEVRFNKCQPVTINAVLTNFMRKYAEYQGWGKGLSSPPTALRKRPFRWCGLKLSPAGFTRLNAIRDETRTPTKNLEVGNLLLSAVTPTRSPSDLASLKKIEPITDTTVLRHRPQKQPNSFAIVHSRIRKLQSENFVHLVRRKLPTSRAMRLLVETVCFCQTASD